MNYDQEMHNKNKVTWFRFFKMAAEYSTPNNLDRI